MRTPAWTLVVLLAGCGGQPAADVKVDDAATHAHDSSWVASTALQPERFEMLLTSSPKDAWVALHAGRYQEAYDGFGEADGVAARGKARAALALASLHGDLHASEAMAWSGWLAGQHARTGFDEDSAYEHFASWMKGVPEGVPEGAPEAIAARIALHQTALAEGPQALLAVAAEPVMEEPATGFTRHWYDPRLHATLGAAWADRAAAALGLEDAEAAALARALTPEDVGLEASLFASWLDAPTLLRGAPYLLTWDGSGSAPSWSPLEQAAGLPAVGDLESAREQVRALDGQLDTWREDLANRASADGRALLLDLGLIERFRAQWLVARAREALNQDRPLVGLAFAERALDAEHAREVGPTTPPEVFAVLARARLAQGHTREALDALTVLTDLHPEILGLTEVVGNLAVLQGVDRHGDSKEN